MASGRSFETSQHRVAAALVILSVFAGGMVMLSAPVSAQTVSCDTTVAAGGSIQSAINSAAQGDTICVESGTYAQEVTINVTGVSLVAADMDNPPVLDGTGLEVGVYIENDSVLVEGFEIRNYEQWGIKTDLSTTSQGVTIRNNTIANNSNGLSAGKLTNGKVVTNSIVDNEGDYDIMGDNIGIQVWDSPGIEIRGNNVSNNGDVGIMESSASDDSVIANNTLIGNGITGISYQESSSTVTIAGNIVTESSTGIQAGSDTVVRDNVVEVDGTGISGTSSTEVVNNSVTGATTGITLDFASDTIIRDNDITAGQVGIRIERADDTGASDSANVTDNTASGNSIDLWLTGSEGVVVTNNTFETGVGLHSDTMTREEFVHTFENNTVQGDPLFYATGVDDPTVPATVGQVIVANTTNVTVEGHEFDGVAAPIQVYFSDGADIRSNTIANDTFEEMALIRRGSISVLESRGTLVRDNQITGGTVGEISIHVDGGREVAVVNNTVSDSPAYGIHIGPFGTDHEIRANTVSGASEDGIHVTGTIGGQGNLAGVVVADNLVSGNARYGINVRSQAQGTQLTGNTVTQNAVQGLRVIDSNDVWIEANVLSQNDGAGLIVEGASANAMIVDNVVDANLGPGIHVRPDPKDAFEIPDNVTVRDNQATNHDENDQDFTASFYGIRIEGILTARVDNNFVTGNDRGGILVEAATDVRVAHNTLSDNGDVDPDFPNIRSGTGIHVTDSSAVTVNGNTVTNNPVYGIEVDAGSSDVNVSYNNIEQNVRRGVFVENANDVLLGHNIVRSNDIGIYVASITAGSSADSVTLFSNLVELNTQEGVFVTGADELYAEANEFLDNAVGVHLEGVTANATLRDNEIAGNTVGVNGSGADHVVDARENWWGAANGPSGSMADPVTGTLADGDGDPVTDNVRFDPWSSEESSIGGTSGVVASSLVHLDGTEPDLENVSVDAFVASGLLQIQIVNTTADPADLESRYELGGVGADETTAFEIEVQVNSSEPRVLVGAGNVSDWDVTENGDGTTNVTIVVSPIASQQIVDCDTYNGCTPPIDDWPEGQNDTATVANDAIVSLAADPLTGIDTEAANRLNGTVLTTDAQAFGSPVFDPVAEELSVFVAAPSTTVEDTQNEGFYRAFLPNALLDDWGVENGSELQAAFDGKDADFTSQEGTDGITIAIDMHYSAGEVTLSTLDPASFDVEITNVNGPISEGDALTVDATVENTGDVAETMSVTLDVGGTERDSVPVTLTSGGSQTVSLSWMTGEGAAGDYTATVASANDSDTATVTVESASTSGSTGGSSTTGGAGGTGATSSTPSPTVTPEPTPTVTATAASTATATPASTGSPTAAATSSPSATPSSTPTASSTGEVTASPPMATDAPETSPDEAVTETPGQPGFGFLVALFTICLLGLGLSRRRN